MDFVRRWSDKTEIGAGRFIGWLDITASKFYDWRDRYGKVNEHLRDAHRRSYEALKAGPGDSRRSHTPDEYLEVAELEAGVAFYEKLIRSYFARTAS